MLTGKYLVNLDSEDEGEIFIGCAGGIDTVATFRYTMEEAPKNYAFFRVDVSDLQGGHSGDDIDKGRVNSNKTVARLLWDGMQSYELKLSWFDGGNLRNAIPARGLCDLRRSGPVRRTSSSSATNFSPPISKPSSSSARTQLQDHARTRCRRSHRVLDARDAVRTGLLAGGRAQRRDRHVVRRAGAGRNLDQPRFGQIRGGRPHRRHLVRSGRPSRAPRPM